MAKQIFGIQDPQTFADEKMITYINQWLSDTKNTPWLRDLAAMYGWAYTRCPGRRTWSFDGIEGERSGEEGEKKETKNQRTRVRWGQMQDQTKTSKVVANTIRSQRP